VPARFVGGLSLTSLAAWIGSLPLVAYYFHIVTPSAHQANVLAVPLCALVLISNLTSLLLAELVSRPPRQSSIMQAGFLIGDHPGFQPLVRRTAMPPISMSRSQPFHEWTVLPDSVERWHRAGSSDPSCGLENPPRSLWGCLVEELDVLVAPQSTSKSLDVPARRSNSPCPPWRAGYFRRVNGAASGQYCQLQTNTPRASAAIFQARNLGRKIQPVPTLKQNQVIQSTREKGWLRDIEIGAWPVREPMAGNPDDLHQEPACMIEDCREGGKPARQQQAGQIANQHTSAHSGTARTLAGCADGRHDMKVVGHQRQGADPRRKGG